MKNPIQLKKITHSESLSEETNAYTADLYFEGIKIGFVRNAGHGGCDEFCGDHQKWKEANDWCIANLPKWKGYDGAMNDTDLESHCGDVLSKWLTRKDIMRDMNCHLLFKAAGKIGIFSVKPTGKFRKSDSHLYVKTLEEKHGAEIVLNTLPIDEAVTIFEAEQKKMQQGARG